MPFEHAERHYQGEAGRRYHQLKRGIPECAIAWVSNLRAEKLSPYISAEDVVLEYGVGAGWNLAALKCARKIGYDVADEVGEVVRALDIEFIRDTKALSDASADVVICHHTLEHVLNPVDALREMWRLLKPEGRVLLFVPLEPGNRDETFSRDEPNHHLYSWSVQTLGNLVEETGFKLTEARAGEFGYSRFAAVWAAKFGLGERGFRSLRRTLHLLKPAFEVRVFAVKKLL